MIDDSIACVLKEDATLYTFHPWILELARLSPRAYKSPSAPVQNHTITAISSLSNFSMVYEMILSTWAIYSHSINLSVAHSRERTGSNTGQYMPYFQPTWYEMHIMTLDHYFLYHWGVEDKFSHCSCTIAKLSTHRLQNKRTLQIWQYHEPSLQSY
jgi:hypothetical protein